MSSCLLTKAVLRGGSKYNFVLSLLVVETLKVNSNENPPIDGVGDEDPPIDGVGDEGQSINGFGDENPPIDGVGDEDPPIDGTRDEKTRKEDKHTPSEEEDDTLNSYPEEDAKSLVNGRGLEPKLEYDSASGKSEIKYKWASG